MLAMILLSAAHCADPDFCPALAQLESAVHSWREQELLAAYGYDLGDDFTSVTPYRPRRISDVYCGQPSQGAPRSITCKGTWHYRSHRDFMIVQLIRDDDDYWLVQESMTVSQSL